MSIQRDVNPENDKKLDKMLDAKFGKQSKSIITGETLRKVAKQLTMRQAKQLHAGVRAQWKQPKVKVTKAEQVNSILKQLQEIIKAEAKKPSLRERGRRAVRGVQAAGRRYVSGTRRREAMMKPVRHAMRATSQPLAGTPAGMITGAREAARAVRAVPAAVRAYREGQRSKKPGKSLGQRLRSGAKRGLRAAGRLTR